jgi:hypothetical protein
MNSMPQLSSPQFPWRRLYVAMTLIAVACCEFGHMYLIRDKWPPYSTFDLLVYVSFLPILGAGLLTPLNRPILGAFLGFLGFVVAFLYWALTRGISV